MNASFKDRHEREDVKQFVRLELIKSYKNHKKYADWHNIVLGIINRRILDYKKKLYRTPLFTTVIRTNTEDPMLFMEFLINQHHQSVTDDTTEGTAAKLEAKDFLETILSLYAWSENEFTEWEQEYMERMYASYTQNPQLAIERESIRMELMGIESQQRHDFRKKVKNFIIKLKDILQRGEG